MKNKKFLGILFVLFCATFMCACQSFLDLKFVSTQMSVYNFYKSTLLDAQETLQNDLSKIPQSAKITKILDNAKKIEQEEIAIIASIECYNSPGPNKETYINYKDGGLISVKLAGRTYVCTISLNSIDTEFSFTIAKNSETNEYSIGYSKKVMDQTKTCSATVSYDTKTSRLCLSHSSYNNETLEQITVCKDFYLLSNNHTALKLITAVGSGNNKSIRAINTYREIENFSIKASSLISADEKKFDSKDLSLEDMIKTSTNEKCGYVSMYNSKNPNVESSVFGQEENW